jgi:hypothetical protein
MDWFGKHWGASICDTTSHVSTPTGETCIHCGEPIKILDDGLIMPVGELSSDEVRVPPRHIGASAPIHLVCFMREIVGSVGHQNKTCSCFGGGTEDPDGMTKKEAAEAAYAIYSRNLRDYGRRITGLPHWDLGTQ